MKKLTLMGLAAGILLSSCNNSRMTSNEASDSAITDSAEEYTPINATSDTSDMHTAQNALDVAGTYKGILPCADCEGIETVITLKEDRSFVKTTTYRGKGDGKPFEESGKYSWVNGSTIALDNDDAPNQYFVSENRLTALDMDGQKINGELAENYVLEKQ